MTYTSKGKLDYAAEGMAARDAGKTKDAVPYKPGTPATAWMNGWDRRDRELKNAPP